MLRLNVSEKFETWANNQLTSPSPEEVLIAIEDLGLEDDDPEDIDIYLELAQE